MTTLVPLLTGTLSLHDVRDVERLARSVVARRASSLPPEMTPAREDDLIVWLVSEAWRLAETYDARCGSCRGGDPREETITAANGETLIVTLQIDPRSCSKCRGSGRGASFSGFAFPRLSGRVIDWVRREFGDSRYPTRPAFVAIDADGAAGVVEQLSVDDFATDLIAASGLLELVADPRTLSPRAQWVMLEIVAPLVDESATHDELASRYGVTRAAIDQALDAFAGELGLAA